MGIYRNCLNIQGGAKQIKETFQFLRVDKLGCIDLETITPIPPWVQYLPNEQMEKWYKMNWGTSENTTCVAKYNGESHIYFDTLNSDIRILLRQLSLMFPEPIFDYIWASEDIGADAGVSQFQGGEILTELHPKSHSKQAYELTFDIYGTSAEEYGLKFVERTNSYEYARRAQSQEAGE